ncbi:MAG: peptidoglycan bridge formation glycyltransferase FemA/FemB family protein [Verrucomicrobiia bacterium]
MHDTQFRVEVDAINASTWSETFDLFEDANVYQTWSYGAVRWGEKNLSHLVLKQNGRTVAMAQLRILTPGNLKCGVAYLRWGPLCHLRKSELNPEIVQAMATALREEYVLKRRLFLRILPNAFLETPRAAVFQSAFERYESEPFGPTDTYRTFVLDLEPPLETLRKKLDQKWRNQLNRAEKNGLEVVESDAGGFQMFLRIYDEMLARKRFDTGTDVREFERMQHELPVHQRLRVLVCKHEGVPAAGLVAAAHGNSAIYLFGATSDQGMTAKGSYLLHWLMIKWLKENGIRYYNLGGINPERNPGVYHFKQGFSGQDVLYMHPLVACSGRLSAAFVKAGKLTQGRLRRGLTRMLRGK